MSGICGEAFLVRAPFTETDQSTIYGRNALCQPSEEASASEVLYYPASGERGSVKCDSAEIDGAATFSVILSKPVGCWGAESGSNEKGVCVGLLFSDGHRSDGKLSATDLVRLGLERGGTASETIDAITSLSAEHGPEGESKDSAKAAFVVCDPTEVWLLDIVGSLWAAKKVPSSSLALKAGLSVDSQIDRSSDNLSTKLQGAGIWDGSGELNFSALFDYEPARSWPASEPSSEASFGVIQMFETLRASGVDQKALTSHVSVLSSTGLSCHWFTATPNPLESVFKPFAFTPGTKISPLTKVPEGQSQTLLHKLHSSRKWEQIGDLLKSLESTCVEEVNRFISEHSGEPNQELDELMKDCVEAEVKFYR
ncbi:secernin-1 [Toxorhynchites rutilus septentrionalis]|uniref:secernin-1 n=1 Tax=Toxorhynchites rutilus septentrionalis TaxID=329112 RepID=UPI00247A2E38|nr:secernin-1 [Toxorhynchites rutilus septentrionalis]